MELGPLREDPSLLTDVWVTRILSTVPKWLEDPEIRIGIRAMLDQDRCLEERRRLGIEADNLCRCYGRELAAIEVAMRQPKSMWSLIVQLTLTNSSSDAAIAFLLRQKKEQALLLQHYWQTPLTPRTWFKSQSSEAIRIANKHCGISELAPIYWIHVNIQHASKDDGSDDLTTCEDEDTCIADDTLEALFDHDIEEMDSDIHTCDSIHPTSSTPDRQLAIEQQIWLSESSVSNPTKLHVCYS